MLSERELQSIWYGDRKPGLTLKAMSTLFGALGAVRRSLFASGIFRRVKLPIPVIVVGNISVGGTGKTPLVIALVEALRSRGWKPGVINRGFGGSATGIHRVDVHSDPVVIGDEAKLIFDSTRAPVTVGRDRVRAARALLDSASIDVIVSDDGLQHYRLRRDIEICVIDGQRRYGNGRLLPAGPLREPMDRLRHIDFRVCNGAEAQAGEIQMRLIGDTAVALNDSARSKPLVEFSARPVHAVAGIGNPERFFAQLRKAGLDSVPHPFPDHHAFTAADIAFAGDSPILMTEKDAVKCRAFAGPDVWCVPVRAELPAEFYDAIETRLREEKVSVRK